jgi:hypothetical protein
MIFIIPGLLVKLEGSAKKELLKRKIRITRRIYTNKSPRTLIIENGECVRILFMNSPRIFKNFSF